MDRAAKIETDIRRRVADAGVTIGDAEWASLPAAARRRLEAHPITSEADRRALRALATWLLATFPPGWNAAAE